LFVALAGCSSTDVKQTAGGVATVSALVVALPLVPVAEGYHFLSGDIRELKAKVAALKVKLDPVYEERLRMIEARDPVADARSVVSEGCELLLPSIPDGRVFPGYFDPRMGVPASSASTPVVSPKSPTYRFLEELMDKDKLHTESEHQGVSYSGKAYTAFLKAGWRYKERFNREIVRLTGKEPNQSPEPTPTSVTPPAAQELRQP
jgi:hypothetical protein